MLQQPLRQPLPSVPKEPTSDLLLTEKEVYELSKEGEEASGDPKPNLDSTVAKFIQQIRDLNTPDHLLNKN